MADVTHIVTADLIDMNAAAGVAVGFLNPLGAQLDAMIAANAGFRAEISAQLDASIALQASLSLSVTDPFAYIKQLMEALVQLQASISAALSLPPLQLALGAELSAAASLSLALSATLSAFASIEAAIALKIPALRAAADALAALKVGPAVLLSFNGLVSGDEVTLSQWGTKIAADFSDGVGPPGETDIGPDEPVAGIIMLTAGANVSASIAAVIMGVPELP